MHENRSLTRRKGEKVESLKASFWLKVIAIILTLTMTGVSIAVYILFSIYETTTTINERGYQLGVSIERNSLINKYQNKRLDDHDGQLELFDVRLTEQEKINLTVQK